MTLITKVIKMELANKKVKSLGGYLLAEEIDCDCLQDKLLFGNLT